jgi:hypothetical protein
MIIERPKGGDFKPVGDRFQTRGRMPESVLYHATWIDARNARCFQVMEAPDRAALDPWIAAWSDLVDFEVVPVERSAEFWAAAG